MKLTFGTYDHLDRSDEPLVTFFENRLKLAEAYDRAGFRALHIAEHHFTPLGMAPSPSVFLSAVAQRTRRLRFGPLVYTLNLHHPLRLADEICMLDHMSGGRFMFGVGRGAALVEHQRFGVDPAHAPAMYHEAFAVIMKACESDVLNFEGKFYSFKDYLVQCKPLQRPHPPIWYGAPNADAVGWAAPNAVNVVSLGPAARAKAITDRYRKEWADLGRKASDIPMMGITRHITVAPTDAEAKAMARENYRLKRLTKLIDSTPNAITSARLIASTGASSRRYAILSAGALQGVTSGQPVRTSEGLVGRVVAAGRVSARVLLITDGGAVVPVRRLSDGYPALATGRGDGGLDIRALQASGNPFKAGDVFVTSGAGGIYPPDVPVALAKIERRDVTIARPLADPARLDFAIVLPPYVAPDPSLPAEPEAR